MYIACPKCDTNFVVSPEQIGPYGRKVRCSRCTNIWHQKPRGHIRLEPVVSASSANANRHIQFAAGVNLPALLPIKIPTYLYGLPVLLIISIIILSAMLFQNAFGIKSYDTMKAYSIKDVHVENIKEAGKINISYKIVNSSNNERFIPLVRIRLLDADNRVLKSHVDDQSHITLAPKQYVGIKTEFISPVTKAQKIDIMLGNKLDFILQ